MRSGASFINFVIWCQSRINDFVGLYPLALFFKKLFKFKYLLTSMQSFAFKVFLSIDHTFQRVVGFIIFFKSWKQITKTLQLAEVALFFNIHFWNASYTNFTDQQISMEEFLHILYLCFCLKISNDFFLVGTIVIIE